MSRFLKPLELLCEKAIGTGNRPMGAGEALRRVLECLGSGILMAGQSEYKTNTLFAEYDWMHDFITAMMLGFKLP